MLHLRTIALLAAVVLAASLSGCNSLVGLPQASQTAAPTSLVAPMATTIPAAPTPTRRAAGVVQATTPAVQSQPQETQTEQTWPSPQPLATLGLASPTPTLLPQSERRAIFDSVWQKVEDNYLYADFNGADWNALRGQYEPEALAATTDEDFYNLLGAMVGQLKDGHSRYVSPDQARQEDALANGNDKYVGVGILTQSDATSLLVIQVFPGSPAEQAGVKPRDRILGVDGQPFTNADKEADKIRGPEGSTVQLTVRSPEQSPHQLTMQRRAVNARITAAGHRLEANPSIGYLSIPSLWAEDMDKQAQDQIEALMQGQAMTGLIIDLRRNSGGWRTVLKGILSQFTTGTVGSFYSQTNSYPLSIDKGPLYDRLKSLPVLMLVDKGTQSYAEVLAATMQAQGRVKVVGETTAGNTETIYPYNMPDGSRLWVAQEGFKLLDGTSLEGRGVIPDVVVSADWTNYQERDDPGILKAIELIGR